MTIKKDEKDYTVVIYKNTWALLRTAGKVKLRYSIEKALCPDFEALKTYVQNSDLF